ADWAVLGEIGLTPRAKKVIELAVDEARRLNHGYIGTEHLLLGLVREGEGIAAGVLESHGVNLYRARAEVARVLQQPQPQAALVSEPLRQRAAGGVVFRGRNRRSEASPFTELRQAIGALVAAKNKALDAREFERAAQFRSFEVRLSEERTGLL